MIEIPDFFKIDVGLRQRCLLSPILFAIYINGLADEISPDARDEVSILMFADDIVLVSEDRKKLEELMEITYQYSRRWRFSFNYDKSAVVVFNSMRTEVKYGSCINECMCGNHWKLGSKLIKQEIICISELN